MKTTNLYSFKFHLLLSLLLLGCFGMAQQTITKSHYRIINDGFEASLKYEKALEHTFLDDLRYLDTRRQIQIEGTQISIELFSAQELLANYGKPISPLTDRKSAVITPIKFKLAKNNYSLLTTGVVDNEQQTTANIKLAQKETITTFGSTLGDKGGLNANYSNNEIYTKTIYSDNGESPYLNFTLFDVENHFDVMYIYDGPSATSKLIGAYSGSIKPKTVKASGSYLTVIFVSDGSNTRQGWSAVVGRGIPQNPPSTMGATDSCGSAAPFCS